jgi:hypothetical protein
MFVDDQHILCCKKKPFYPDKEPRILPVIPDILKPSVLEMAHSLPTGGHLGIAKTYKEVASKCWWRGLKRDVENHVNSCSCCQTGKTLRQKPKGTPMGTIQAFSPFEIVALNLVGPLRPTPFYDNKYILTCVNYFTQFAIAIPIPDKKSKTVARALFENLICEHGTPTTFVSDRGTEFEGAVSHLTTLLHMEQRRTVTYHPQCNGLVER